VSVTIPSFLQIRGYREGYGYLVAADNNAPAPAPLPLFGGSGQRCLSLFLSHPDLFAACYCGSMLVLVTTIRVKADVANYGGGGSLPFIAFNLFAFAFSFFWSPGSKQTNHLLKKREYRGGWSSSSFFYWSSSSF
jgi:hypothetical protein